MSTGLAIASVIIASLIKMYHTREGWCQDNKNDPGQLLAKDAVNPVFLPIAAAPAVLLLCAVLYQRLRDFQADGWMSVGLAIGSVVKDNTGCIMAHALGVHLVDVSGNTFFEAPPTVPQVRAVTVTGIKHEIAAQLSTFPPQHSSLWGTMTATSVSALGSLVPLWVAASVRLACVAARTTRSCLGGPKCAQYMFPLWTSLMLYCLCLFLRSVWLHADPLRPSNPTRNGPKPRNLGGLSANPHKDRPTITEAFSYRQTAAAVWHAVGC